MSERGSVAKAALLGGVLGGLFSGLPYVGALNACCCALAVLSGGFAGWVLASDSRGKAGTARSGLAGLLAGLLAGGLCVPVSALFTRLLEADAVTLERLRALQDALRSYPDLPPLFAEAFTAAARAAAGRELNGWTVLMACTMGIVFSFFGLIGGLASGAILGSRRPPAPPRPPQGPPVLPVPPFRPSPPSEGEAPTGRGEVPQHELPLLAPPAGGAEPPPPPVEWPGGDEPPAGG